MAQSSSKQSRPKTKRVCFELHAPEAYMVILAGSFNGWDVNSLSTRKDKKGTWKVSVPLEPKRHEYRFWVDGVWADDPNAWERVENPFGSQNCVKTVS